MWPDLAGLEQPSISPVSPTFKHADGNFHFNSSHLDDCPWGKLTCGTERMNLLWLSLGNYGPGNGKKRGEEEEKS